MADYLEEQNDSYAHQDYDVVAQYDRVAFLLEHIQDSMDKATKLIDLGCAKGEILAVLSKRWPNVNYVGVDTSQRLLDLAKNYPPLQHVKFLQHDIQTLSLDERFDIVLASGVMGCFDDPEHLLDIMLAHLHSGGRGYVFTRVNPGTLDTFITFRTNRDQPRNAGLNCFGIKNIEQCLAGKVDSLSWHPFEIKTDIPRTASAGPTRSYTVTTDTGRRLILNNLGLHSEFALLEFKKR